MHEYSIVEALITRVHAEAKAQGATAVHRLTVRIGELSGVDVGLLKTAYETFRDRTICSRAELEVETVPAAWACPTCGGAIVRGAALRCVQCGDPARLVEGDEMLLQRIEMEVP